MRRSGFALVVLIALTVAIAHAQTRKAAGDRTGSLHDAADARADGAQAGRRRDDAGHLRDRAAARTLHRTMSATS